MHASTAFFAGVGTVLVAIAAGLGGGLTVANILSPYPGKHETTKLERRMSPEPVFAANEPQAPVPHVAATLAASNSFASAAAAPNPQDHSEPQRQASNPAPSVPPAQQRQASAVEDANAKAREADLKRLAEQRKAERYQQWTERPQWGDRQQWTDRPQWGDRQQWTDRRRYREWRGDERNAREDDERKDRDYKIHKDKDYRDRDYVERRGDFDRPMGLEFPQMRPFGPD
jgi:hypothetical protein